MMAIFSLLRLIPAGAWRLIGLLCVAAALIGVGAWGGGKLARNHYEPLLVTAGERIGSLTTANGAMQAAVAHQNAAIAALENETEKRERAAKAAVRQAHKAAVQNQARAQAVLLLKPPAGVNLCTAAMAAFDDELKLERGAK